MVQIINRPASGLENLGTGLGGGIGQALSGLANTKIQQILQRQNQLESASGLRALGFEPTEANLLSSLDPSIQKEIVKQKLLAPSQEAYAQGLADLLGQPGQQGLEQQQISAQPQEPGAPTQIQPQQEIATPKAKLTERQATQLAKLGLQKQAITEKQKAEAFKATKEERKEIINSAKVSRDQLHDLDRMEELEKEGKLDTAGYTEFLKRSGLDIPALQNVGSEEFNKISANFLKNAKQVFGARVSNFEIEQFLKTIPSLSQSPEGRKRVIANLKYVARANIAYNDALKEVMSENKGIPPLDLLEKIDFKIDKKLDKISKKFKEDLVKPVPAGQNRLITALQATAGNVAGRLPKAAAGAGLGAYLGKGFGPVGIVGGGILGGLAGLGGIGVKDVLG